MDEKERKEKEKKELIKYYKTHADNSFFYESGLGNLQPDMPMRMYTDGDDLIIQHMFKDPIFRIKLGNVLKIEEVWEKKEEIREKSVIKRGVAGGLLFGPLGAVVGGMSGVGTKEVTTYKYYKISYLSEKNPGVKVIMLKSNGAKRLDNELSVRELNRRIKGAEKTEIMMKYLEQENSIKNDDGSITL